MQWYDWLSVFGVGAFISAVFAFLVELFFKRFLKRHEEALKDAKEAEKRKSDDNTLIKLSLQALLRDRLLMEGERYIEEGWISLAYKENYHNMYSYYHKLGQNGVMSEMYENVMHLPVNPPKSRGVELEHN